MWKRRVGHIGGRRSRRRDEAERRSGGSQERRVEHMRRVGSEVDHSSIELRAPSWVSRGPYGAVTTIHMRWRLFNIRCGSLCVQSPCGNYRTCNDQASRTPPKRRTEDVRTHPRVPRPGPGRPPPPPTSVPPQAPRPSRHAPRHHNAHKHNPRSAIITTYAQKYAHTRGGTRPPCHLAPRYEPPMEPPWASPRITSRSPLVPPTAAYGV